MQQRLLWTDGMLQYLQEDKRVLQPLSSEATRFLSADTDPVQIHLDLALSTPDFLGDTVES